MKEKEKHNGIRSTLGSRLMGRGARIFARGLDLHMQGFGKTEYENFRLIPIMRNSLALQNFFQQLAMSTEYTGLAMAPKGVTMLTLWKGKNDNLEFVHNVSMGSYVRDVISLKPLVRAMTEHIRRAEAFARGEADKERLSEARRHRRKKK